MEGSAAPYRIDKTVYRKFDERENVFGRLVHDRDAPFYQKSMYANVASVLARELHGYSRIEFAKALASWTVYDYFNDAFSWEKLSNAHSVMEKAEMVPLAIDNHEALREEIKQTAKAYGADLVGIARRDDRWIYSHDISGKVITIPDSFQSVIVMAIAMDPETLRKSPAFAACYATGIAYSKMAFCISCLAEFIRYLGHKAIPMGNDTMLSIPLAIDAGLGELGRNGLLITSRYGPCVRLCKVFSDLPLDPDKPIAFGVHEFCKRCTKCADACEADAIQTEPEPSFKVVSRSNNRGICRWR
jgi:epoxyqueuosine reductase